MSSYADRLSAQAEKARKAGSNVSGFLEIGLTPGMRRALEDMVSAIGSARDAATELLAAEDRDVGARAFGRVESAIRQARAAYAAADDAEDSALHHADRDVTVLRSYATSRHKPKLLPLLDALQQAIDDDDLTAASTAAKELKRAGASALELQCALSSVGRVTTARVCAETAYKALQDAEELLRLAREYRDYGP